jgi:hypothetical protein
MEEEMRFTTAAMFLSGVLSVNVASAGIVYTFEPPFSARVNIFATVSDSAGTGVLFDQYDMPSPPHARFPIPLVQLLI